LKSLRTTTIKTRDLDVSITIYRHMAKDCWKLKKEKEIRNYYKYNKVRHLGKNCRSEQKMKNRSIQKDLDNDNDDEQESFVRGLK